MENTNMEEVKNTAKALFYAVDIKGLSGMPFICQHPFTSSMVSYDYKNNKTLDLNKCEDKEIFREYMFELIDKAKDVFEIMMLLNSPWYMTFLQYSVEHLSEEDLGKFLCEAWVMQEFPNRDKNVTHSELVWWFKMSDKKSLMNEEDYKTYETICATPNLKVYRGISLSGKPNGLSWTTDLEKAKWFARRFGDNGKVYELTIKNPKNILAYFSGRDESEVIVNTIRENKWKEIA